MIYGANTIGSFKNALADKFDVVKARKFKESTRRELFLEKKANGGLNRTIQPESTQRLSIAGEFLRTGFTSPDGISVAIENLAKKYTQLREELLDEYKGNENELFKKLGELNQGFETALNNVASLQFSQPPAAQAKHIVNIPQSVIENMARHMDAFFESFIADIQHHDFDTAFTRGMNNLSNIEFAPVPTDTEVTNHTENPSKQNEAMSSAEPATPQFSHMINIGTENNPIWTTIRADKIFISTGSDSSDIRVIDLSEGTHGLDERTVQMLKYTQMLVQGMNNGTGNGNQDIVGSPIQQLNAKIFNISIAFGEISDQSGINKIALQNAFRDLVLSLFDEAVLAIHGNTDNVEELEQFRAESKSLGESFLNKFYNSLKSLTPQNLQDTGMSRAELAFHEAMNYIYYSVGMSVLGGGEIIVGSAQNREILSDAEFYRQMIEELLRVARENAEIYKQWAEMQAEEAERWRKIMLIAARIASGDNVPPQDQQFLMENSPGMYMIAITSRVERENPKDHESVLSDDEENTSNAISSEE